MLENVSNLVWSANFLQSAQFGLKFFRKSCRLPDFCYFCGLIGHVMHDCEKRFVNNDEGRQEDLQYGHWLRFTGNKPNTSPFEKKGAAPHFPELNVSKLGSKDFSSIWVSIADQAAPKNRKSELELVAIVCWAIWNDRNAWNNSKQISKPAEKAEWIFKYLTEFRAANRKPLEDPLHVQSVGDSVSQTQNQRELDSRRCMLIFVDAACRTSDQKTSLGFEIRNFEGVLVARAAIPLTVKLTPLQAEMEAIRVALRFAKDRGFADVKIHSDCLEAIQTLNSMEERYAMAR